MRRTTLTIYICLLLTPLFAFQFSAATLQLRVDEKATRIDVGGAQAVVTLAVENLSGDSLATSIRLELVDPDNKVRAESEVREELPQGATKLRLPLSFNFDKLPESDRSELLWYRLRYKVFADGATGDHANGAEGIISLSEIMPDVFGLRISAARRAGEGMRYRVRVQATHPVTQRPVGGVQIAGEIELDEKSKQGGLRADAVTDAEGYATLDFTLPASVKTDEADINIKGSLNGFEQQVEATVEFDRTARILVTTDKPIYQPGQILHLRALVFAPTERALSNVEASFEIQDSESTTVFRASGNTSRFGVASADWQIPDNAPLGDYVVKVELPDDYSDDSTAMQYVKISRYDLPNFSVNAKADRAYYLPGQNAEVEVRADYLFGQPVTRGHVKIVRETERKWNFKEQKWETEEGEKIEGELNGDGRFVARIDLQEEQEDFDGESYARFRDLKYAAYLTDASTNRTEQRRFAIRLTKQPIHIYVSEGNYNQAEGMPLAFYVSTSYADGTPAQCEVSMELEEKAYYTSRYNQPSSPSPPLTTTPLQTVRTNRYGVAKVTGPRMTRASEPHGYFSVKLSARDARGRTGHQEEDFWLRNDSVIRVETDKAVYSAGEPVRARLTSSKEDATLFVDVMSNLKVIRSEAVRLENGRGAITFPYGKDFDGRLSIVASFYEKTESRYSSGDVTGRRTILYPRDRELKLDVRLGQAVYRPGEEARANLRVSAADGRAFESVLGIVVFDKAVEERSRTDQEFNSAYGFYDYFRNFWYGSDEIGGVTLRDLERLNVKRKPVSEDLDMVADILLQNTYSYYERTSAESDTYKTNPAGVFGKLINSQLKTLKDALDARYEKRADYPSNDVDLRRFLLDAQIDFDQLRDPWDMPYHTRFSLDGANDVLEIVSAGADKKLGTGDDFSVQKFARPYFRNLGERIDQVVNDYHARTGGFIRDTATLKAELARAGIHDDALLDRWGQPYTFAFGTSGTLLSISIKSGGQDKRFDREERYGSDDFIIWTTWVDSFADMRALIDNALNSYLQAMGSFPQTEAAFGEALKRGGIEREKLLDPFGRIYFVNFKSESRYVDKVVIAGRYNSGAEPEKRTTVVPVSQRVYMITLFSAGADAKGGTSDDFTAATFTSIAFEQSANETNARSAQPLTMLSGATGALTGLITDTNGAVVSGANIVAVHKYTSLEYKAVTDDEGKYLLRNLPSGYYTVSVSALGFATFQMIDVPVRSSTLTKVDAMLQPAAVTETVSVVDTSASMINTTTSEVSTNVSREGRRPAQLSTPRLREYFPETLVWQPTLETDKQGRALLSFKLADNITTWKMSVIGSNLDGEIGTAETEIRAFQPFFVEHDPPRVLTEGDEIALPVVVRNYLDKSQTVDLEIKPEKWFALTGATQKRADVRAGDAAREVFNFRATSPVKDGKQRITAIGDEVSDAIERAVTVHPDGEERTATDSRVFTDSTTLEADIPPDAIKGSVRGEIKIYPNLVAHVFESIEGILERPYGCGEQTISSTYPSLLILRAYRRNNVEPPEKIAVKARRYLHDGYERLLNYRSESGGFSYWGGRADADLALTAYALRFLHDARDFLEVDETVVKDAREWLIKEQRADGSWPAYLPNDKEKEAGSPMVTALIARSLALYEKSGTKTEAPQPASAQPQKTQHDALRLALDYLARRVEETDEPYLIASYALAAMDAGEDERAARAVVRLRGLAHDEGDGSYWSLETNTPFYGWGLAGRIETTALVVQALARAAQVERAGVARKDEAGQGEAAASADVKSRKETKDILTNRGLVFLLRQKDRYGVWYSTQATVNVLDALIALLSTNSASSNTPNTAYVTVNGRRAGTIQLPPANQLTGPLMLDISEFLSAGSNRVMIEHAGVSAQASAQVVSNYYLPWSKALADETVSRSASKLNLTVNFDKTETGVMNEVTCRVKAERIGFGGYGMMLAEIGLPPGADVDRASLERAMKESDWSFNRYDLQPDRLVVYLWPRAGGTNFEFKFRPRLGLNAQTAPFVLYDYYNPEARTALAPVRFLVR